MKMAVITPRNTFEQMFARWSPFFAEGTCESTYYMLRQGLKRTGIELVSIESLLAGGQCGLLLHCEPYRWDILRRFPQLVHVYHDSEPAIVIPMHADFGLKLLVRLVFDAVITTNHRVRGQKSLQCDLPAGFSAFAQKTRTRGAIGTKKLACMFAAQICHRQNRVVFSTPRHYQMFEKTHLKALICMAQAGPRNFRSIAAMPLTNSAQAKVSIQH